MWRKEPRNITKSGKKPECTLGKEYSSPGNMTDKEGEMTIGKEKLSHVYGHRKL